VFIAYLAYDHKSLFIHRSGRNLNPVKVNPEILRLFEVDTMLLFIGLTSSDRTQIP
jgi:hypothetical protein